MSACRSCGAPIRWALTVSGRAIPLDPDPVPDGNLVLSDPRVPTPVAHYVDPAQLALDDRPRYVSHFATCPHADQHRKERTT